MCLVGCTGLTDISDLPSSLITIGEYAFQNCTGIIGEFTLSRNITTASVGLLDHCTGITELIIPSNITTVNLNSFGYMTNLTKVTYPISMGITGKAFQYTNKISQVILTGGAGYNYSSSTYQQYMPWTESTVSVTVTLQEGITRIGNYMFYEAKNISNVLTLPSTLTEIGNSAFYNTPQVCTNSLTWWDGSRRLLVYTYYSGWGHENRGKCILWVYGHWVSVFA